MAELLLDLSCEEIPSSMQKRAAFDLARLMENALKKLNPRHVRHFYGARRIAVIMDLDESIPACTVSERGPRETAPEKAVMGFSRKHGVTPSELTKENGFWVLNRSLPAIQASARITEILPELLWKFPWPKAMRWGSGSLFSWVRPLHHIVCLLDGIVVPVFLARDGDTAHNLKTSSSTEGHRFLSPGTFTVTSATQWQTELEKRHVIINDDKRRSLIKEGVLTLAKEKNLTLVEDDSLVEEISGLVEFPVPLLGTIDDCFMNLPPEVMQVSMRVNQRYFALRSPEGQKAAPYFAFVANRTFSDDGKLCIAGNERVLRARFSDARHFWDLDRKTPLYERVKDLKAVTFHAKIGTQEERVQRISSLSGKIATAMGLDAQSTEQARRAGYLSKADLTTGMVGEFPELQGIMGSYYARHDDEEDAVACAIAEHYMPRGQSDDTPRAAVSVAVALADRLDMLASFYTIGETPSGSGDPYALRRAALGVIRTIRDNKLPIDLGVLLMEASKELTHTITPQAALNDLESFFTDRLTVQLRNEGQRHDVLDATLAVSTSQSKNTLFASSLDGDICRLLHRINALSNMIASEDGINLLAAYRRAANILRIENKKDGPHTGVPNAILYTQKEESLLGEALQKVAPEIQQNLEKNQFTDAMQSLARLRPVMDDFFDAVTVNTDDTNQRINRLYLLAAFVNIAHMIADFGRIEG